MNKLICLFSALLLVTTAQAQESQSVERATEAAEQTRGEKHHHGGRGKKHKEMLEKVDTNKDGQVDLNEFLAHAEVRFQKMDANADGYLSKEEGREANKHRRAEMKEKRAEMKEKHSKRHKRDRETEQNSSQ